MTIFFFPCNNTSRDDGHGVVFLAKANFWTHERTAPLLLQNHGFFSEGAIRPEIAAR
jgi:hypothetical protein